MRLKLSLFGVAAVVLLAVGTASASPEEVRAVAPRGKDDNGVSLPLWSRDRPSGVAPSALRAAARLAPALARRALAGHAARAVGFGVQYPGDMTCTPGVASVSPVTATGHTATLTWSFIFLASKPDFSNASRQASPWWLAQIGSQYFTVEITPPSAVEGPFAWEDAGIEWVGIAGRYAAAVNVAFYVDGSKVTAAGAFLLSTLGPNAVSPSSCLL